MAELFSDEWMKGFMAQWNSEPDLADALSEIGFNSVIAYGFDGEESPRGFIKIENGKATDAGTYAGQSVNWDLRASGLRRPLG